METASTHSGAKAFEHTALLEDSEYIRLFEVCDENIEPYSITCHLTTWQVDQAPLYHAISYTWGEAEVTEVICLNNSTKTVNRNCADVLRQLQYLKTSKYYWMDALCIDQNNTAEKNKQVANMGDVFEGAEHVLACLGNGCNECEYAMRMMDEIEKLFTDPKIHKHPLDTFDEPLIDYNPALCRVPGMDIARFSLSVLKLVQRPYFFRVWVLQEALIARQLSFCFGRHIQSSHAVAWHFEHVYNICCFTLASEGPGNDLDETTQSLIDALENYDSSWQLVHEFEEIEAFLAPFWSSSSAHFGEWFMKCGRNCSSPSDLVKLCSTRYCQGGRDTIFGTLALTRWDSFDPIIPDYGITKFDLAVKYASLLQRDVDVKCLLRNLRMDFKDSQLLERANQRVKAVHDIRMDGMLERDISLKYSISGRFMGRALDLSHAWMRIWRDGDHEFLIAAETSLPQACDMEIILPPTSQEGDIIVWSYGGESPEALVLRPLACDDLPQKFTFSDGRDASSWSTGSRFAIVGRAWMQQEDSIGHSRYNIVFDLEDVIVFIMTSDYLGEGHELVGEPKSAPTPDSEVAKRRPTNETLDNLSLPICKHQFSSIGVLVPEWHAGLEAR